LARIVSIQAEVWLNCGAEWEGDKAVLIKRAIMLLSSVGWDAPVFMLGSFTTMTKFSKLLHAKWISDELINMMMEDLSFQA
jgi:hypothetical protein